MTTPQHVRALADGPLLDALKSVVARANEITAELLVHLGEVDARKLYLGQATSSMHAYCTSRLGLSDAAAFKRIHAARLARRFPIILKWVSSGSLHLSGLAVLGAKLTEDNHRELLAMAAGKSKRDIEQLVASRFPQADVPARIRKLPSAPPKVDRQQLLASAGAPRRSPPAPPPAPAGHVPPRRPAGRTDAVDPLSADRFRVQFTASRGQVDKLRQLQELVSHQVPDGDLADVIERAVDALTKRLLAERFGKSSKPRPGKSGAGRSRRVPLQCDGRCSTGMAGDVRSSMAAGGGARSAGSSSSTMCSPWAWAGTTRCPTSGSCAGSTTSMRPGPPTAPSASRPPSPPPGGGGWRTGARVRTRSPCPPVRRA